MRLGFLTKHIPINQWLFLVPQKAIYKWYILPIGGLYATYHLLGEPETTIETAGVFFLPLGIFSFRKGVFLSLGCFFPNKQKQNVVRFKKQLGVT